ncbi:roadblock/LC7 domain-containing protein [Streptomyces sp. NPDC090493]|uniref:roadblock/LC7 domain-containing protein n=1 Tax=Streptomyces sp. NPDC090493 TaxID=3365964 RepID=UPI00380CA78D
MTETPHTTSSEDYSLVLQPLVNIPKVRHIVVASSDGMLVAASEGLKPHVAEGIAAMSSSGISAMRSTADHALQADAEHPEPNPIETITTVSALGTCMWMPAANNSFLVVIGEPDMPMGIVASTAARQARRLGEKLIAVPARDTGGTQS